MSSSQGATTGASGIATGYAYDSDVLRDASDWTRKLKEQQAFRSYSTNNTGNKNTGADPWLKYGNQFRYTYLFGKFKCGSCSGAAFNGGANGVVGGS